jgi:hypothetical protein
MTAKPGTTVEGLERVLRPGELSKITAYFDTGHAHGAMPHAFFESPGQNGHAGG